MIDFFLDGTKLLRIMNNKFSNVDYQGVSYGISPFKSDEWFYFVMSPGASRWYKCLGVRRRDELYFNHFRLYKWVMKGDRIFRHEQI